VGFFDVVKDIGSSLLDKLNETNENVKQIQQDVMVHKSDEELKRIIHQKEGISLVQIAAVKELKARGYVTSDGKLAI
jgi:hypothetical protein